MRWDNEGNWCKKPMMDLFPNIEQEKNPVVSTAELWTPSVTDGGTSQHAEYGCPLVLDWLENASRKSPSSRGFTAQVPVRSRSTNCESAFSRRTCPLTNLAACWLWRPNVQPIHKNMDGAGWNHCVPPKCCCVVKLDTRNNSVHRTVLNTWSRPARTPTALNGMGPFRPLPGLMFCPFTRRQKFASARGWHVKPWHKRDPIETELPRSYDKKI